MHPCANYNTCRGWALPGEKYCQYCRDVAEKEKQETVNRWKWAGFDKSTDNHRKGYRGQPK